MFHKENSLLFDDYFQFNSSATRHALCIQPITSTINLICFSCFVNSVFLRNCVPYNVLSIVNKDANYTIFVVVNFNYFCCSVCM